MASSTSTCSDQLEDLSRRLQQLHSRLLHAAKQAHPPMSGPELLDRLMNDPSWAWLRPLSALIADIDHVLAQQPAATPHDQAVVAAHVRGMLAGEGDLQNPSFLNRYRELLQLHPELASLHGELKGELKSMPAEATDEAERLHARHQWNMRCKHRSVARTLTH